MEISIQTQSTKEFHISHLIRSRGGDAVQIHKNAKYNNSLEAYRTAVGFIVSLCSGININYKTDEWLSQIIKIYQQKRRRINKHISGK